MKSTPPKTKAPPKKRQTRSSGKLTTPPVESIRKNSRDKSRAKGQQGDRLRRAQYFRDRKHTGKVYLVEGDQSQYEGFYDGGWKPGDRDSDDPLAFYDNGWKFGKMHGEGTLKFPEDWPGLGPNPDPDNAFLEYKGEFRDGLFHGKGVLRWRDGRVFTGDFSESLPHGQGTLKLPADHADTERKGHLEYKGEFEGGRYHGKGVLRFRDGIVFTGDFSQGVANGKAKLEVPPSLYHPGCVYVGDYKHNVRHGKGTATWGDGDEYEGDWEDNEPHGHGTLTYSDGLVYKGAFQKGKHHGRGVVTGPPPASYYLRVPTYEGDFVDNRFHGAGKMTLPNGNRYEGRFAVGLFHGRGKYTYANGDVYDGDFVNGRQHGTGTLTDASGMHEFGSDKPCSTLQNEPSNTLQNEPTGIVHAHEARAIGHAATEDASDILVLGFELFDPLSFGCVSDRFDFVRYGNSNYLTPSNGSFLVVAKVNVDDGGDTLHVGALNTNELQAHYSAHAREPRRLSYEWNSRKCSYLKEMAPLDANEIWYEASGITHCWCGCESTDEFGRVFDCDGLMALLLSISHPGSADLNQEHEMEGSVPSCKFDETFCSLIPSWIHICHRREAST